jgi:putative tryptophan/tyrosine transport system substrate-binding protein
LEFGTSPKWLELLKQIAPGVTRVAVLRPANIGGVGQLGAIQAAASSLGMELSPVDLRDVAGIDRAITAFARRPNGGLIVVASALAAVHRTRIIELAGRHQLPAIYPFRVFIPAGGLISYEPLPTSIVSLKARGPETCRCNSRPSSNSSSTLRPRRGSASMCRHRCSRAPTR